MRTGPWRVGICVALAVPVLAAACSTGSHSARAAPPKNRPATSSVGAVTPSPTPSPTTAPPTKKPRRSDLLPGMPAPLSPTDVYAAAGPGMLSPAVRGARALVYVPDTKSNDVYVIDQHSMRVVERFPVGTEPQHVVPAYDLKTLYVVADAVPGGSLTPIDPKTGRPGHRIDVQDPYNMYFTPDGKFAIVVAEAYRRLDFYDPHTWRREHSLSLPDCNGVDHMDFTANGRFLLASCEFADRMVVVDVAHRRLVRTIALPQRADGMPQDVKLSPDGKVFYVADMVANGVYLIDGAATHVLGFQPTGVGAHGLYVDRSGKRLFVTNRGEGSITVMDLATRRPIAKWHIPGGGSPDMGNLSADGKIFWVSGRYNNVVYAISTADGHLIKEIPVGTGPHGLCVWPQPGRYSLGHTGITR